MSGIPVSANVGPLGGAAASLRRLPPVAEDGMIVGPALVLVLVLCVFPAMFKGATPLERGDDTSGDEPKIAPDPTWSIGTWVDAAPGIDVGVLLSVAGFTPAPTPLEMLDVADAGYADGGDGCDDARLDEGCWLWCSCSIRCLSNTLGVRDNSD